MFARGFTMVKMQQWFIMRPKPLSLCITGRNYMGRSDRRAQLKRHHEGSESKGVDDTEKTHT